MSDGCIVSDGVGSAIDGTDGCTVADGIGYNDDLTVAQSRFVADSSSFAAGPNASGSYFFAWLEVTGAEAEVIPTKSQAEV